MHEMLITGLHLNLKEWRAHTSPIPHQPFRALTFVATGPSSPSLTVRRLLGASAIIISNVKQTLYYRLELLPPRSVALLLGRRKRQAQGRRGDLELVLALLGLSDGQDCILCATRHVELRISHQYISRISSRKGCDAP